MHSISATRDKVHLRQAFQKTHPPGGDPPAQKTGLRCWAPYEHAPQAARVSASQAILDRGYGRPATFSTTDTTQFKRAIDMTDDELIAIVAKARLTIVK